MNTTCRWLHFIGTTLGYYFLFKLITTQNIAYLPIGLASGYAFAWIGHFVFEKNRPATFTYPLWSFRADFRMHFLMLTGRMSRELQKLSTKVA